MGDWFEEERVESESGYFVCRGSKLGLIVV